MTPQAKSSRKRMAARGRHRVKGTRLALKNRALVRRLQNSGSVVDKPKAPEPKQPGALGRALTGFKSMLRRQSSRGG